MSNWVSYQNKALGKITLDDNNTGKFVFVGESLEEMLTLLRLNPNDEIEFEG